MRCEGAKVGRCEGPVRGAKVRSDGPNGLVRQRRADHRTLAPDLRTIALDRRTLAPSTRRTVLSQRSFQQGPDIHRLPPERDIEQGRHQRSLT